MHVQTLDLRPAAQTGSTAKAGQFHAQSGKRQVPRHSTSSASTSDETATSEDQNESATQRHASPLAGSEPHTTRKYQKQDSWVSARYAHGNHPWTKYADAPTMYLSGASLIYDQITADGLRSQAPMLTTTTPSSIPAIRAQLLSFFLASELPNDIVPESASARRNFFHMLPVVTNCRPALENALLAVCMARLGRMDDNPDMVGNSLTFYTSALKELRNSFKTEEGRLHDHTLAAVMSLTMYEFTECPERKVNGYFAHVDGAMELLRLRGPDAHTEGMAHSVFFGLRIHGAFRSLNTHEKSFLAEPDWRFRPFVNSPRGIYDDLMDILLEIPELLSVDDKADAITKTGDILAVKSDVKRLELLGYRLEIVRLGWQLEAMLEDWRMRFDANLTGPLFHPELAKEKSKTDDERKGKLFPVTFYFSAFILGHAMTLYWAATCMVWTALGFIYEKLEQLEAGLGGRESTPCSCLHGEFGSVGGSPMSSSSPASSNDDQTMSSSDSNPTNLVTISAGPGVGTYRATNCLRHFSTRNLPPLHHRSQPEPLAWKICQSVEYFLQPRMGCLGSSVILPALIIVRDMLDLWEIAGKGVGREGYKREKIWIGEMMVLIARRGNGLAGYA
jgi:hypothetical protein